tara:strand:- start:1827 stop:2213 length:387 start_codon:yes stop_codon:yes gene_type:complete
MSLLTNIQAATTVTRLISAGNANAGAYFDGAAYKGPLTFYLGVGHTSSGLGAAHLNVANVTSSGDNVTFGAAGSFTAVVNTANVTNVGTQVLSFDSRTNRYWRCNIEVSGTNTNVPLVLDVVGQKERV